MQPNPNYRLAAPAIALILSLLGCAGTPAPAPAESAQPPPSFIAEPEMRLEPDIAPGIVGWELPEVEMLVMHHDNGNAVEIPQLAWRDGKGETDVGLACFCQAENPPPMIIEKSST